MNEFQLINRYFDWPQSGADLGVGDDAALMSLPSGMQLAVSADMLVEGRHFFAGTDPHSLGRKVLAVNLSDMAAMGATPRWFTLSLSLPDANDDWLAAFSAGLRSIADEHHVSLVGGDTTRGPLTIAIQIMGEVERGTALMRGGACPGDDLWVSGQLGTAAAVVMHRKDRAILPVSTLILCESKLDNPVPRLALGRELRALATSAIDISDGLVGDAGHICERSCCGAEIELERVPCLPELNGLPKNLLNEAILSGGDDYELCFTAPPERRNDIESLSTRLGLALTRIGCIVAGQGVRVLKPDGTRLEMTCGGFDHFG